MRQSSFVRCGRRARTPRRLRSRAPRRTSRRQSIRRSDTYASALGVNIATMTKTTSGLYYKDKTVGTGTAAVADDSIRANYTLWLTNGTKIDSSTDDDGAPIEFLIGDPTRHSRVRGGSHRDAAGRRAAARSFRRHSRGASAAAGAGKPPVPPNANVVFEIKFIARF